MIHITLDASRIDKKGWDYPVEELEYLCKEHDGETFVLFKERLWEANYDEKF